MSAGTASLFLTLLFVVFVCADPKIITVKAGQDVTLTCRAPNNKIRAVEWTRADLGDKYVLLCRAGRFYPDDQHPSFENRVDLQDRQMKDGDVSLILKDVTINDAGTYECRVFVEKTSSWKNSFVYLRVLPPDPKIITAESGQDVTLTCRAPNNKTRVVEWTRADLGDKYVLLCRAGRFYPDDQHPSFKNRVDLQDRQMKDGDVSLILKDVTINDTGTYECHVFIEEKGHEIPNLKLISIVYLIVDPPGQTGGQEKDEDDKDGGKEDLSVGLIVGLTVSAVLLLVAVVVFLIYRRKQHDSKPHNDPATRQPLCTPEQNSDDLKMN